MSDFPEQEKTELQNEEEFSTIFSDPTAHKKTAEDVKKKKLLPIIIASFFSGCSACGRNGWCCKAYS